MKTDSLILVAAGRACRQTHGSTVVAVVLLYVLTGCVSGPTQLMPTPNVYAFGLRDPFPDVPPALQNNRAEVLYLTDRGQEKGSTADKPLYTFKRSRSVAFGVAVVEFGKNVSWDQLVRASKTGKRDVDLPMTINKTTELIRFPPTPRTITALPEPGYIAATQHAATMQSVTTPPPATVPTIPGDTPLAEELEFDYRVALEHLSAQLAKSPVKDVYVFVHGYNNSFYDSVVTIAEMWHFLGRQGVPVAYSWPAGRGGLLRGYTYDRESGEFTIFHLKTMLRIIAACPDVRKVHLIAHSRGTAVLTSALRELRLEIGGSRASGGMETRQAMKLGTLVLAAPDLDLDVVIQRLVTVHIGRMPEHFAMYVCSRDKALGASNWLFGGSSRLGTISAETFSPQEMERVRRGKTIQIIDAKVSDAGLFGHDYFHSSPAVSSDIILLIRYGLAPGADTGRPLGGNGNGFWSIDDDYPNSKPKEAPPPSQARPKARPDGGHGDADRISATPGWNGQREQAT